MQLKSSDFSDFDLIKSPGDGHCLCHSISTLTGILTRELIDAFIEFINANHEHYLGFASKQKLFKGLKDYVKSKVYDSEFCDILPKILCDCLNVDFIIVCKLDNGDFSFVCLEKDTKLTPHPLASRIRSAFLPLLKTGDHYDALMPRAINPVNILSNSSNLPEKSTIGSTNCSDGRPTCRKTKSGVRTCKAKPKKNKLSSANSRIKLVGLNVNGFLNKYEKGILDIYISKFDVICLSETHLNELPSNFTKSSLGDYIFLNKKKGDNCQNDSPYGGFHGLGTFVHPRFQATIMKETACEAVLWVNVKGKDADIIVGNYYCPCVTSKYYQKQLTDEIAADILAIRRQSESPIYLLGDANAHCGSLNDTLQIDGAFAHEFGLDLLFDDPINFGPNVAHDRVSADKSEPNANGNSIINLCQSSDLKILNGRAGQDRGVGNHTCFAQDSNGNFYGLSTIDLCLASTNGLRYVHDFEIDTFDRMLSDRHTPVCLTLDLNQKHDKPQPLSTSNVQTPAPSDTTGIESPEMGDQKVPPIFFRMVSRKS